MYVATVRRTKVHYTLTTFKGGEWHGKIQFTSHTAGRCLCERRCHTHAAV